MKIQFNPVDHTYFDQNGVLYTSVTQLIGKVTPKYDSDYWAVYRVLDRKNFKVKPMIKQRRIILDDKSYTIEDFLRNSNVQAIYGLTVKDFKKEIEIVSEEVNKNHDVKPVEVEQVLHEWKTFAKQRTDLGSDLHNKFETKVRKAYNQKEPIDGYDVDYDTFDTRVKVRPSAIDFGDFRINRLIRYALEDGFILYPEKILILPDYLITGRADIVAVNFKKKTVRIFDWKTNSHKIEFESGYYKKVWNESRTEKLKTDEWVKTEEFFNYPLHELPLCTGVGYTLQLSLYMTMTIEMLQRQFGEEFKPDGCTIIHTTEHGLQQIIPVDYLSRVVKTLLEWRKKQISSGYSRGRVM